MNRVKESRLFHRIFNERIKQLKEEIEKNQGNFSLIIKLKEVQNLYNNFYSLRKEN